MNETTLKNKSETEFLRRLLDLLKDAPVEVLTRVFDLAARLQNIEAEAFSSQKGFDIWYGDNASTLVELSPEWNRNLHLEQL